MQEINNLKKKKKRSEGRIVQKNPKAKKRE